MNHLVKEVMGSSFIIQIILEMSRIQLKINFRLKILKTFIKLKKGQKIPLMKTI
jgi:hypothetical protein